MKKKLPLLLISLLCVTLSGCAQLMENLNSIGQETPKNAPPGYHSFEYAKKLEKQKEFNQATANYCVAAELGHPQAKSKCIQLSYQLAINNPFATCKARNIDKKADQICQLVLQNKENQARAQIRAVINQQKRNTMKARIQSGEFAELKAEEF